ncbi:DinB/UmuC family translesion DNA polymerase [Niabella ginsengisoli]|uniref:DNA polymerase Y-family little finger domain-containing protein n=1 Tax=Niabella ginsengisoli TaxID=522298 RepID=A0ABS9SPU9_9BACT|nr:hypothetical protein [Niabella ginsengisoli]MCH5600400.1 hypothetical protein [Niabella ginsengisoli]
MSHETTFHENQTSVDFLHSQLVRLTEKNAFDLRQDEKLTGCLTVKLRYADFETTNKQETIPYTSLDDELIEKAKEIFDRVYQHGRPVRLIGVRFSQLVDSGMQMNLFNDQHNKLNLYKAVDDIKTRFGDKLVSKAVVPTTKKSKSQILYSPNISIFRDRIHQILCFLVNIFTKYSYFW